MLHEIAWQTAAGGDPIEIADDADSIAAFAVNGQALVQPRPGIRAAHTRPVGRGNTTHRVSFRVTTAAKANAAAAKQYIIEQSAALAAASFDHARLEGVFGAVTWRLADAALDSHSLAQVGMSVVAEYTFVGGEFSIVS